MDNLTTLMNELAEYKTLQIDGGPFVDITHTQSFQEWKEALDKNPDQVPYAVFDEMVQVGSRSLYMSQLRDFERLEKPGAFLLRGIGHDSVLQFGPATDSGDTPEKGSTPYRCPQCHGHSKLNVLAMTSVRILQNPGYDDAQTVLEDPETATFEWDHENLIDCGICSFCGPASVFLTGD